MKPALILTALATATIIHAQVDSGRVVATVNGTPIHGREYYGRMEVQPGLGSPATGGRFLQIYPGYLTLRFLIEEHLIIQLAESQGVKPTAAAFDKEFQERMTHRPEQFKAWLNIGFTEDDMKHAVMVDMCQFAILTRGITITDFEVEKYYKDNTVKFTLPKRYQVRIILVADEAGRTAVDNALAAGRKFEDVASELSIDISKLNGGSMGLVTEGEAQPNVRTALAAAKKGQTTGWLEQKGQFAKFLVEDVKGIEVLTLDDKLKRDIRESLMRERGQAKNNVPVMMQEFRKKASLEFFNFPFAEDLKRYFEIGG